ncbi:uncharacterized protein K452DRAFT_228906 [Aplosporella prunicola CBS 121167]|uniref:Uncharacterized protein n=1 Tax=Aplosporella prunicola CBS 121167 TaxID=1176127 RepID=A0A6A6BDS6_9PEZI|nr:uncharacterized protein K452DRAFT_228906 [Aplosporella prunicola CBS 121167]KAF2141533.1 hypothetical protein K452DRAFT_228906 [Aplosporella prunicola CBS 121167]
MQFDDNGCPTSKDIVYSPFKLWTSIWPDGSSGLCWNYASCVFTQADESRKQQFAATALVMGLLPVALLENTWPDNREVAITGKLPVAVEILVRTLGLKPVDGHSASSQAKPSASAIATWASNAKPNIVILVTAANSLALCACYAVLVILEYTSKRSAIGCTYFATVLCWYIAALVPASTHTLLSRISSGQGVEEFWLSQIVRAFHSGAGVLLFSSIMAVTPIELFTWVVASFVTSLCGRLLALFICILREKIRPNGTTRYSQVTHI